jgi:aminopeptidase N
MKLISLYLFLFISILSYSQQVDFVDFKTAKANINFNDLIKKELVGTVSYEFEILKDIDSVYIDAINMKFYNVDLNGKKTDFRNDFKRIWIKHKFKANNIYQVGFNFEAYPQKALYFIDWNIQNGNKQIWSQGQGKYTSNWLPSIDDMNEKIEFDLTITFDKGYEVISNGKIINKQLKDSLITWHYDMQQPMSSYLVALAIGKYNKKVEVAKSGIPLEMYYYPKDSLKFESTYRYTKQMFNFLEEEIGVPYPWQNYKQVPVKDFLYAGMENTSTTIFSEGFVIDSIAFVDKNYVNVNAHELAHQWFGDLVTETSGVHHWLQEGFATYYALLAERAIFGYNYYYWRLYEYANELIEQEKIGAGTSLLNPKSSSTTFYKKGAWVLHMLREKVGETAFKEGVRNYLKKNQFKNVTTSSFISEIERTSKEDLNAFTRLWLESDIFPYQEAIESLKTSNFIQEYLTIDCNKERSKCSESMSSSISDEAKIKIISQKPEIVVKGDFNNSLKVRQAIAKYLTQIPLELKQDYESLLNDKSYLTIEYALYNLWVNFPKFRSLYLEKTKHIEGFNDKNIRCLWLVLAINSPEFEQENTQKYFEELRGYTNSNVGFETRINAFQYLNLMQTCDAICKENLKQASKHHNWRFSKFAKDMLKNE